MRYLALDSKGRDRVRQTVRWQAKLSPQQLQGVEHQETPLDAHVSKVRTQKPRVKIRIVCDHHTVPDKLFQLVPNVRERWLFS